ncbi:TetR/AcrR family transcriptional regulator [Cesiribacter sp. SM1]|uniref:TetR/AcrR family transcriptional regulator n=1 Tax=Cesiribacter sp. SM1 TaxID=2861196 RepID=UPI001CD4CFC2|nr:TetR/AcrR family transcriptional regulator [Cesiribacter sp. SM1]
MSPRTVAQNEEIRQERREQLLNTALKLFAEEGYEATSISKIAREAGVAKGLLYNYFASKEELMEQIIYLAMEKMAGLFQTIRKEGDPKEVIKEALCLVRDSLKRDLTFWKFYKRFGSQLSDKKQLMDKVFQDMQEWVLRMNELMAKLGFRNPELETFKLSAIIDGITSDYVAMTEHYPLDAMIDYLVETYQDKSRL